MLGPSPTEMVSDLSWLSLISGISRFMALVLGGKGLLFLERSAPLSGREGRIPLYSFHERLDREGVRRG